MMRVVHLPRFALPLLVTLCRPWLKIGLMVGLWSGTACAAENSETKLSRLGFTFDQHAHDLAIAAAAKHAKNAGDEAGSPPPGVIRLPKYVVNAGRVRLEQREMLTAKGRVEVAEKRYLSPIYQKTLGPLAAVVSLLNNPLGGWAPNGPEATTLYEDDEQKRRNLEMGDLEELAEMSDRLAAKPPAKAKTTK